MHWIVVVGLTPGAIFTVAAGLSGLVYAEEAPVSGFETTRAWLLSIGPLVGLLGIVAGYVLTARAHRKRDERRKALEDKTMAASLGAEIYSMADTARYVRSVVPYLLETEPRLRVKGFESRFQFHADALDAFRRDMGTLGIDFARYIFRFHEMFRRALYFVPHNFGTDKERYIGPDFVPEFFAHLDWLIGTADTILAGLRDFADGRRNATEEACWTLQNLFDDANRRAEAIRHRISPQPPR